MPNTWHELYQPAGGEGLPEPYGEAYSWKVRMQTPDAEGWPSGATDVPVLDETFFFRCNEMSIVEKCKDYLDKSPILQSEIDECVALNLNRCMEVQVGDLPYENGWLQVQACGSPEIHCSDWSSAKAVDEPVTSSAVMICVGILLGISIWRRTLGSRWRG